MSEKNDKLEWEVRSFNYKEYDFVLSTGGASMIFNDGATTFSDRSIKTLSANFLKNATQKELNSIAETILTNSGVKR